MSDYMQESFGDELFDALLEQAVRQNLHNEIMSIPSEEELEQLYTFSEEHNKRMKKLFAADSRREVIFVVLKWTKVAVVTVCVSATLLFGTMMASAEFRAAVSDVIITWYERFTKFQSPETEYNSTQRDWFPEYLPEGFTLYNTYELNTLRGKEYGNSSGVSIDFSYIPSDASVSVDSEGMEYSAVVQNDITYHIFSATDEHKENIIVWDYDGYRFTVIGDFYTDEMLKMAFSIK